MEAGLRIAVVGDVHGAWTPADTGWFDRSGLDLILVVGDLAGLLWSGTLDVARALGALRVPTVLIPGNHDATYPAQLGAEAMGLPALSAPFAAGQDARVTELTAAVAPWPIGAYSLHALGEGPLAMTWVAGRPHPMGGPSLSFAAHLQARYGIASLEASAERLCALVDACPTERIGFVSHNGPTGMGSARGDLWGRDFDPRQGDWGDPDLAVAIDHARSRGKRVLAVVAGHMHRRLRGGGARIRQVTRDGTLYLNAAEVPRIVGGRHHHVALTITEGAVYAEDHWVDLNPGGAGGSRGAR